ncbi:MocR-like pyridoxine biosynthesis transcription factor PdxR [Micromonospora sp. CB01531]|uniref:MocR-like pyridoxine biosynthesis transcription factor PdxR n=1 Tax=Micromonospora sp. CB01531 TaxID=1718947 RepID=UPI00093D214D|nr:PLP-dependent aminotransferase family protein [Micromonospora sp. CB01531]OKI68793.1 GntR family transcriptional regulator [Micromonospora sp. CB01531]
MDWADFGVDLHLELDASGGRRAGLERALRAAIRDGRLPPSARLPATRTLATELGLSRGTVSAAYDQLVAEGWLVARVGAGTEVSPLRRAAPAPVAPPPGPAPFRYDLRPGSPDVGLFPVTAWLRATRRALAVAPAEAYGYGDPRGRPELRTALAGYLGRARGVLADPERIVVTTGYVQALVLLTTVLRDAGTPAVAMEDPGLPFHREVVRRHGGTVLPLPVDERGARTDLLGTGRLARVGAAVVTPAHQFPIGVTLHPARRHALADWARATGGLVVEDDYDGEFRYDRQPVGAVQGTAPEQVAYVGTAAKTLGPALRLAWLVLPARLVDPVVDAKRHLDLHTETIGQLALADLIGTHGYDRQIRTVRRRYRQRRDLLLDRLGRWPGLDGISAGLHATVDLPADGPTEAEVLAAAGARGLALGGLGPHRHHPAGQPGGLVVGYAHPPSHAYPAAVDLLARVLGADGRS